MMMRAVHLRRPHHHLGGKILSVKTLPQTFAQLRSIKVPQPLSISLSRCVELPLLLLSLPSRSTLSLTPLSLTLSHHLQISINGNTPSRCDLKSLRGHNTLLFENASFCFRFTFQLPDPNYEERQHLSQPQAPSNIVARTPQKLWVCPSLTLCPSLPHFP
jgi:hypothetical protein